MNIHTYDFVSTPGFEMKFTIIKRFDLCKHGRLDSFWMALCDNDDVKKEHPYDDPDRGMYGKPICLNEDCPYFKRKDDE